MKRVKIVWVDHTFQLEEGKKKHWNIHLSRQKQQYFLHMLTIKTLTSFLALISSTKPRGLPLGRGIVPKMVQSMLSRACLTARINA